MNCCKNDHENHENHHRQKKGHSSHMLMMVLCCGLPLLLLASLPLISRFFPGAYGTIALIIPFLCPLMMLPMMLGGMINKKNPESQKDLVKSVEKTNHSETNNFQ